MAVTDHGLFLLGSFTKGDSPSSPANMGFGTGSATFNGSTEYLENEVDRHTTTWAWSGRWVKGTSVLTTSDSNGSNIQELGLAVGAALGSDLFSRDISAIGDKDASFSVTANITVKIERP